MISKKVIPIKKIGNLYYTIRKRTTDKDAAEKERFLLNMRGKTRVEKKGKYFEVWHAPRDIEWQVLARMEYNRRKG